MVDCSILLLLVAAGVAYGKSDASCAVRCTRIHARSLAALGLSPMEANRLLEEPKELRDVCWKTYNYLYCMESCPSTPKHKKFKRRIRNKCMDAVQDIEDGLLCINKYHSFLEIKCSSFMNEAVRLRRKEDRRKVPDRDTCRFLHMHASCLENNVGAFCPSAHSFFRRPSLRHFFLSFLLPKDDRLFSDRDLDACQFKDNNGAVMVHSPVALPFTSASNNFIFTTTKESAPPHMKSIIVTKEDLERARHWMGGRVAYDIDTPNKQHKKDTVEEEYKAIPMTSSTPRRSVFDSQEDLAFTPPNFHYSSFRQADFAYKYGLRLNHSKLYPPETHIVTPVDIEASFDYPYDEDANEEGEGDAYEDTTLSFQHPGGELRSTHTSWTISHEILPPEDDLVPSPATPSTSTFDSLLYSVDQKKSPPADTISNELLPPDQEETPEVRVEGHNHADPADHSAGRIPDSVEAHHVTHPDRPPHSLNSATHDVSLEPATQSFEEMSPDLSFYETLDPAMDSEVELGKDHSVDVSLEPADSVHTTPSPPSSSLSSPPVLEGDTISQEILPHSIEEDHVYPIEGTTIRSDGNTYYTLPTDEPDLTRVPLPTIGSTSKYDITSSKEDFDKDRNEYHRKDDNVIRIQTEAEYVEEKASKEGLGEMKRKKADAEMERHEDELEMERDEYEDTDNEEQSEESEEEPFEVVEGTSEDPIGYTPLINGGRVAVKPIRPYQRGRDQAVVNIEKVEGDSYEIVVSGESEEEFSDDGEYVDVVMDRGGQGGDGERTILHVALIYSLVFFILFILIVIVVCVILIGNRRRSRSGTYHLAHSADL